MWTWELGRLSCMNAWISNNYMSDDDNIVIVKKSYLHTDTLRTIYSNTPDHVWSEFNITQWNIKLLWHTQIYTVHTYLGVGVYTFNQITLKNDGTNLWKQTQPFRQVLIVRICHISFYKFLWGLICYCYVLMVMWMSCISYLPR